MCLDTFAAILQLSNPALQFAQHQMADHRHAGFAVVEARDRREILAAVAP